MKKKLQLVFCFVFLGLILAAFVQTFMSSQDTSKSENRELAPVPKLMIKRLDKFPDDFNTYWADHFGFREEYISLHHAIKKDLLGISPVHDQVIIAKEDWYFIKGKPYNCFTGHNKFTPKELREGRVELQKRADVALEMGVPYVIFVAPNKHRIYEDKLPFHIRQLTDSIQVDQLLKLASEIKGIKIIDLAPALVDVRNRTNDSLRLYQKTDNHWNAIGGFIAYQTMVTEMIKMGVKIDQPTELSDFNMTLVSENGGALARYLQSETTLKEQQFQLDYIADNPMTFETDSLEYHNDNMPEGFWYPPEYETRTMNITDSFQPKILWFRDSFGRLVAPHLIRNFGYTVEIFDAWKYRLNEKIIIKEKPDVVVTLILERNLKCLMTGGNCEGNF